jgi:hypothetical protein
MEMRNSGSTYSMSKRFLSYRKCPTGFAADPASHSMCTWGFCLRVNLLRREADHSPQSDTEVKNEWGYTSTPLICLHDVSSQKYSAFQVTFVKCTIAIWGSQMWLYFGFVAIANKQLVVVRWNLISNKHVYTLRMKYCLCSKNYRQESHANLQVIFCQYNVR